MKIHPSIRHLSLLLVISAAFLLHPAISRADWKDDLGTLRIGMVANGDIAQIFAKAEPFRLAVEEKLGVPVEIIPSSDLFSLIRNQAEKRVEYAIFSATSYAAAWQLCECVEPLVVAKSSDGSAGTYPVIIVRKGGPIKSPNDLVGKTLLVPNRQSIVSYALPIYELQKRKIDLTGKDTEMIDFAGADEAIRAFADGEGDAIFGWSSQIGDPASGYSRGTMKILLEMKPELSNQLSEIWTGSIIPHRAHSIQKNLAAEPKNLLRELLVGLFDNDPVAFDSIESQYGGGFALAQQSDFNVLVEYIKDTQAKFDGTTAVTDQPDDKAKIQ